MCLYDPRTAHAADQQITMQVSAARLVSPQLLLLYLRLYCQSVIEVQTS